MSAALRVEDYPLFERHLSDLRQCSADDHDGNGVTFMVDEDDAVEAINFDGVTREYCDALAEGMGVSAQGYPRSVDALYLNGNGDAKIALIEFKNGGLSGGNRAVLSSRERQGVKGELKAAIEEVLLRHFERIETPSYSKIEDELVRNSQRVVDEKLGRRTRGVPSREESRTVEAVKTKAMCSAFLLQRILDKPASYIEDNVDFILVYNPDVNPGEESSNAPTDDRSVPKVDSIDRGLPGRLSKLAKRPYERFGLKQALWPFFRKVLTYTSDELCNEYIRSAS